MPSRRDVLSTAAVGSLTGISALAGCLGGTGTESEMGTPTEMPEESAGSPSESESPTGTPTDEPTPDILTGDCEEAPKDWVDPTRDDVNPESLPEGPPEWTEDAVREFVVEYERTYLYDSILQRDTKRAGSTTAEVDVETTDYGFVVTLRSWFYYTVQEERTDSTETATAVAADGPHPWRRYAVAEDRLVRASGSYDRKPAVGEGTVVECWTDDP